MTNLSFVGCMVIGVVVVNGAPVKDAGGSPCTFNDLCKQRGLKMPVCSWGDKKKKHSFVLYRQPLSFSLPNYHAFAEISFFFGKHLPGTHATWYYLDIHMRSLISILVYRRRFFNASGERAKRRMYRTPVAPSSVQSARACQPSFTASQIPTHAHQQLEP